MVISASKLSTVKLLTICKCICYGTNKTEHLIYPIEYGTNTTTMNTLIDFSPDFRAKYKTIDISTIEGLDKAEKLNTNGWIVINSSIDTVQLMKKA